MNHLQVSVMISNQDKDFFSYMIDLKVSDGDWGQVGVGLGGSAGIMLFMFLHCEGFERLPGSC